MFELNSNTCVNKEFKLREIFKMIGADKKLKEDAQCIEKINLRNVISKNTINIEDDEKCKEIYVFEITLNEERVPIDFIRALDKVIELHTYFIFKFLDEAKEWCIYREITENKIKRGQVYEAGWGAEVINDMPICISIYEIYKRMVLNLIPLKIREDEDIKEFLERFNEIGKLKKDIKALENKAFKESQPRKKFDISREAKRQKDKLRILEGEI